MTLRVLALDIEGGYGGSSRSLLESVRHLPDDIAVEVWCRRDGPARQRYDALGIPCRVMPTMPHISSLPRLSRNLYAYGRFGPAWRRSGGFRRTLLAAAEAADVVHLNHEGLFLLARWLRRRSATPIAIHIRTHLPSTVFSRWQYRTIAGAANALVFITENEARRAEELAGRPVPGTVVYNIVATADDVTPDASLAGDSRFKVAVLSNYSWMRGLDRMIDVALALRAHGREDVLLVMAGNMSLTRSLPGELGRMGRAGGTLADYAELRGVGGMFRFLGHVAEPEAVLAACDVLAKPTREANPWGRDILEGLAAGKPVLAVGRYDRFVETGVTGLLQSEFDAERFADAILRLADDPAECARLGTAGRERVATLCDPVSRAADLADVWREAAASN